MLTDQQFEILYTSGDCEPSEFFHDALCNSISFDLGLGFFHLSGFQALAFGFAKFISVGGTMRIIINDQLEVEDKDAIDLGNRPDLSFVYEEKLLRNFNLLFNTLKSRDQHFFKCISWLIASKRLEIKAVIPNNLSKGIAHQKYGIFRDRNNNKLAFNGSANFSYNALKNNIETITCFPSWNNSACDLKRVEKYESIFEQMWNGQYPGTIIIPLEKVKTAITEKFGKSSVKKLIDEDNQLTRNEKENTSSTSSIQITKEIIPNPNISITLRSYQDEAINNWFANLNVGIYAMATGTGKTITALASAIRLLEEKRSAIVIITLPFIHLAEQWNDEAIKFGFRPIVVAEARDKWVGPLSIELDRFKSKTVNTLCIISVNDSLRSEDFQYLIRPFWEECLLIADEMHYLGSRKLLNILPTECKWRLGLSATPERYYDEEGTSALFKYFDKIVYELPLKDAIGKYLTPYYYYPIPVEMQEDEFDEYKKLTARIEKLSHDKSDEGQTKIERLLILRSRVQNNSRSKLIWLDNNITSASISPYTLVYAGETIFEEAKKLLGYDKLISIHEFTGEQNRKERKRLLERFSNCELKCLIAMKCLDEGVDIPPTRVAYFLASSGNPREFVQRRGRVLRKYPGKEYAIIYDLIAIPPLRYIDEISVGNKESLKPVKAAFKKEYKRVKEFSSLAINNATSLDSFYSIADKLDLIGV